MYKLILIGVTASALVACGSGQNSALPTQTQGPVAMAEVPPAVPEYATVTLDGSPTRESSTAASITSYSWAQTSGPPVVLSGNASAQASFTAPQVDSPTTLSFRLSVQDNAGAASNTSATIEVFPATAAELAPTFVNFSMYQISDGNAHNNLRYFDGPPLAGSILVGEATLSGVLGSPIFSIIDSNGNVISKPTLSISGNTSLQPKDFIGTITIPSVPFRLIANGTSIGGQTYAISSVQLITPMNMTLGFVPPSILIAPGASAVASLQIYNAGSPAIFSITYSDPNNLLKTPTPSVQVGTGQTVSVPVRIMFPPASAHLIHATISATAEVSGDKNRVGAATLQVWLDGVP